VGPICAQGMTIQKSSLSCIFSFFGVVSGTSASVAKWIHRVRSLPAAPRAGVLPYDTVIFRESLSFQANQR
jgi:hypothetical protein